MKTKPKFPIQVRRGSVTIKIYRQRAASVFTVTYYEEGARKRSSFGDLAEAREEAEKVAVRLCRNDGTSLTLAGAGLLDYLRAKECLAQCGGSLSMAASEVAHALTLLKGKGTILEAVRYFCHSQAGDIVPIRTEKLVADLLAARHANHASKRHLSDLKSRLGRFAAAFQCDVHTIEPRQVPDFLLNLKLSARSVNNFRMAISNLFSHARLRGHAPEDFDPLCHLPWAKETEAEVEIYSPDELKTFVGHARHEMLPYLAIAAFSGLRQAEIARLDWSDTKDDHIIVRGSISKTREKRHAPLPPNLAEWLRPFRQAQGPVVRFVNVTNELGRLARKANLTWKRNGLRHSFGSYRLALAKDPAAVAYEIGNSTAMIFKHYRKLVTEAQGQSWFNLYPDAGLKPLFRVLPENPNTITTSEPRGSVSNTQDFLLTSGAP